MCSSQKSWIEEKCDESWRWWFMVKIQWRVQNKLERLWYWIKNERVWEFSECECRHHGDDHKDRHGTWAGPCLVMECPCNQFDCRPFLIEARTGRRVGGDNVIHLFRL